jgi:hypothetical protein
MRIALLLLVSAFVATPALAGGGSILFTGGIREPTCPMAGPNPACLRPAAIEVRAVAPRHLASVPLLAYAMARSPAVRWRVTDIVYR